VPSNRRKYWLARQIETSRGQAGAVAKVIKTVIQEVPKKLSFGAVNLASAGGAVALEKHVSEGQAVYALQFDLKNDASTIKWADALSKPDVFPVVYVAGEGTYLIPELKRNYDGGRVIWTYEIPKIPNGQDVSSR